MCHCNDKRIRHLLMMLPVADLKYMADNGPYPIEILCHHCGTPFTFNREEIRTLYAQRYANN
jgi:molecular chaperone Hsp33